MEQAQNGVVTTAREHANAYRHGEERPSGGYVTVWGSRTRPWSLIRGFRLPSRTR
jgi:hypothetical protein